MLGFFFRRTVLRRKILEPAQTAVLLRADVLCILLTMGILPLHPVSGG